MGPPEAVIVPWQLTGSLIVSEPAKPCPASTVSVLPAVWVKPKRGVMGEAGGCVESGGHDQERVGGHAQGEVAEVSARCRW